MKRLLVFVITLALGCSINHRAQLVQTHQGIEITLAALDDIEFNLCLGSANAIPSSHCTTDVAARIGLTDARHQAISAQLIKGFTAQEQIGVAIALWQPGQVIDVSVALDAARTVNAILAEMNVNAPDLASFIVKAKQWADDLERIRNLFGGSHPILEVAYGH